ncbi:MAG: enoyl-CoA hydratase-related protein [Thermaerobacter sp.]|nr:enoyl-CoA hydratase-related protein [Thermaerobacter sp.]
MADYETLKVSLEGGVMEIQLSRPETLNALNRKMKQELTFAFKDAARRKEARVVLLSAEGRGFCSGADLKSGEEDDQKSFSESLRTLYNPMVHAIVSLPKPVIAAVQGVAAGAGMSLAMACDMRLCGEAAQFIAAFSRIALVPDSGLSYFLPRLVGLGRAMEMTMLAEPVGAQEAVRIGLANRVYPDAELGEAARDFCRRLADGPCYALGLTKQALQRGQDMRLDDVLDYEASLQELAGRSGEYREGVNAFREKRKPDYSKLG